MDFQEYEKLRDGLLAGSESSQIKVRQWLRESRVPKFQYNHYVLFFLTILLKTAPNEKIIEHAKASMLVADKYAVGYEDLGRALIETVPDGRAMVIAFLQNNPWHIEVPFVTSMMLEKSLSSGGEEIVALTQHWLQANPNHDMTPILERDLKHYLKRRKKKS